MSKGARIEKLEKFEFEAFLRLISLILACYQKSGTEGPKSQFLAKIHLNISNDEDLDQKITMRCFTVPPKYCKNGQKRAVSVNMANFGHRDPRFWLQA